MILLADINKYLKAKTNEVTSWTKSNLQTERPTLNYVIRLVVRLGVFLTSTGDDEPSVKTIWIGMQCNLDFIAGVSFYENLKPQKFVYN